MTLQKGDARQFVAEAGEVDLLIAAGGGFVGAETNMVRSRLNLFARDIEQMIPLRDVEALSDLAGRIRSRRTQLTSVTAAPTLEPSVHDQLK